MEDRSEERFAALERRMEDAESRLSLLALEAEYARSWDSVDADAWAALFTESGIFEMVGTGGRASVLHRGREALAGFCRDANSRFRGLHLMHLPALQVSGDRASAVLHFRFDYAQHGAAGLELNEVTGSYDVRYVRVDGVWQIEWRLEKAASRRHAASYLVAT